MENWDASLDYLGLRELICRLGPVRALTGEKDAKRIGFHCGAGERDGLLKTDKRIKEKTVVTVVHLGKVGNLPMWLAGRMLGDCAVF